MAIHPAVPVAPDTGRAAPASYVRTIADSGGGRASVSVEDMPEAIALERAAEWRMRKADADPSDDRSLAAARQLEKLAGELRALRGSTAHLEYIALHN